MNRLIKLITALFILGLLTLAFIVGTMIRTPLEVQREIAKPDQYGVCPSQVCICDCGDVYVDCCCPTEVGSHTPTTTPTEQATTTASGTPADTPTISNTPAPTATIGVPTKTPKRVSRTPTTTATVQLPTPTLEPTVTVTPGCPTPTPTEVVITQVFCHCEQGEGEGAEGRKNCHPVKYTRGHSRHEWDYWSTDGTCTGWNH